MLTDPSKVSAGSFTGSRDFPAVVYAAAFSVVVSSIFLSLLLHHDDPVRGTGDGAADVDEVALRIDSLDAEMSLSVARRAHVTRHLLALDDAGRIGARSDGAGTAVLGVSVRVRSAVETVALDYALKS